MLNSSKCQQLFINKDFSMKTSLYNIFETENTTASIKVILESLYKVLLKISKNIIYILKYLP